MSTGLLAGPDIRVRDLQDVAVRIVEVKGKAGGPVGFLEDRDAS